MKITELLKKEAVKLNVNATDKDNVIDQLIDLHVKAGNVTVTACPTGIAHTYMAAENLTKKA